MDKFAQVVGRSYHLFDYVGAPDAERVTVMMGSGAETAHETVDYLNAKRRESRPAESAAVPAVCVKQFIEALPSTVRKIAVLDRTKESGAPREPLYLDVVSGFRKGSNWLWNSEVRARHRRRTLRSFFQRIHARDGQGGLRQPGEGTIRKTTSPSASMTTSAIPVSTTMPIFPSSPKAWCAPCSMDWARMAPWAPTRIRSRSSAKTPITTRRATLFTTRKNRAR